MRRWLVWVLGSVAVGSLGAAGVLSGCSSDTTVAGVDSGTPLDATTGGDTGSPDGGGGGDASDAGFTTDAPIPTITSFRDQMANELCTIIGNCCAAADAGASDAGKFDATVCRTRFKTYGFEYSLTGLPDSPDPSKYTFDPLKGQECLGRIQQLKCGANNAADYKAATDACFAALKGKAAAGATCESTLDCAPGNYCDLATTKCVAIKAAAATCSPTAQNAANDECSYRSSGAACDTNTKQCVGLIATGQECASGSAYNASCQSGVCDQTTLKCATSAVFVYPSGVYPAGGPVAGTAYEGVCESLAP